MNQEQRKKEVANYLRDEKVLIVEPAAPFGQLLISCLVDMGAKMENIVLQRKYRDAFNSLFYLKPKILIAEFFVEEQLGMSLVNIQGQFYDEEKKVSILTTHNASDSAVAEAAEGTVDEYILKPYSMGELRNRLESVILKKMNPTDYLKKIGEGKKFLLQKDFDRAAKEFIDAAKFHETPALAFFYCGFTQYLQMKYEEALAAYRRSLMIHKLHYKSMCGEFDTFYDQKKYQQAFNIVPTILKHFPVGQNRLRSMIISAVYSQKFDEVSSFAKVYQAMESPSSELTNILSTALLTTGKFQIRSKKLREARIAFEEGLRIIGPDVSYLEKIIRELLKLRAGDDALYFLQKFPSEQVGQKLFVQLKFLVDEFFTPTHELIERGRKIVGQGWADTECFRLMVRILVDMNKKILAEDIASKAIEQFPEMRSELNAIMGN